MKIIMLMGASGTGKTSIANELAAMADPWVVVPSVVRPIAKDFDIASVDDMLAKPVAVRLDFQRAIAEAYVQQAERYLRGPYPRLVFERSPWCHIINGTVAISYPDAVDFSPECTEWVPEQLWRLIKETSRAVIGHVVGRPEWVPDNFRSESQLFNDRIIKSTADFARRLPNVVCRVGYENRNGPLSPKDRANHLLKALRLFSS